MSAVQSESVGDAVILAAGNGDRFKNAGRGSKLLHPVLGQPLILRTLETAASAGMTRLHVILGYEADRVRSLIERHPVPGVSVDFAHNEEWHLENGVSAARARALCGERRFALLMGDHLFDSSMLARLAGRTVGRDESLLAVDTRTVDPAIAEEATKVQLRGDRIVAIGKHLSRWDAIDTGVFIFSSRLFDALDEARAAGETTLSAGVQRLAQCGLMRAAAVAAEPWCDVDTLDDLTTAESLLAVAGSERA